MLRTGHLLCSNHEKCTCHFLVNSADRPRIWANHNQIRANPGTSAEFTKKWRAKFSNFKRLKNREDGSDFEDFWTESIAKTKTFSPKIVKIGAILAIFWPFEAETPLLGELSRSSRDSLHNPPQSGIIPGRSAEFTKKWHVDFW